MNLSLDVLKYCIIMLIGAYLGVKLSPSPKPEIQYIEKTIEVKSGTITRKVVKRPDGSQQIDEVHNYLSNRSSDVQLKQDNKKNVIAIIPKYDFRNNSSSIGALFTHNNVGIFVSSDKQIGLVLSYSF